MTLESDSPPCTVSDSEAEKALLLSVDKNGRIPFPEGNHRKVAVFLRALSRLDQRGHIERRLVHGYLAYYLTESGERLKAQAAGTGRQEDRRTPSMVASWSPAHACGILLPALVAAWLLAAGPVQARLGESPNRMEARYGVPVKFENGVCARDFRCTYKHGGMIIMVDFLDEKSQCETYSNESGEALAPDDIKYLMEINRRGGKWAAKEDTKDRKRWMLNVNDAIATEQKNQDGHKLEIRTSWWQHFVDGHPALSSAGVAERLKDF
jgi:hypothetical protein